MRGTVPFLILFFFLNTVLAQQKQKPLKTRILFVLDGSGSMKESMGAETRYDIARDLLYNMIDSLERSTDRIEFGLRVFGHQSPDAAKDCKDSRLEIDFASRNAYNIKQKLKQVKPLGNTPIAYSLFEAARDFPVEPNVKNAIILITDGIETCEGDPCAIADILQRKKISMKPFVIGLGLPDSLQGFFDCVGIYFDAQSRKGFQNVLDVVVSQALNTTTVQVNLLNAYGKPTETDVEMTFYDAFSKEINYNFVHTMDRNGLPDTFFIDPVGKYNLTVHTTPPVSKESIELTPGKHNFIAVDVPQGVLDLKVEGKLGFSDVQCIVRKSNDPEILFVQDFNTKKKFITGYYDLELLTVPRQYIDSVQISQGNDKTIEIPLAGALSINSDRPKIVSVYYTDEDGALHRVHEYKNLSSRETIHLQPGEYVVIHRPNDDKQSVMTRKEIVEISPGGNKMLNL